MVQDAGPQKLHQRAFGRLLALVTVVFAILAVRLWQLQIVKGMQFTERSEANRMRSYRIGGPRGMIYDRNGEMLVDNRPSFSLIFNPAAIAEKARQKFLETICREVACDVEVAQTRLSRRTGAITLKEELTRDEVARVEALGMFYEGAEYPLSVEKVGKRIFKYGPLFAHTIGYTGEIDQVRLSEPAYAGYQPGDRVGQSGVEASYEAFLRGEFGKLKVEENARGMRIRSLEFTPASPGNSLVLNIDLDLQKTAARALAGQSGAVVALDPRNGHVLAIYNAPSFDPDLFTRPLDKKDWDALSGDPRHPLQNKAIAGLYPPGSTFKVVAALAGLQEGEINASTIYYCEGKWKYGERVFRCHNEHGHGAMTVVPSLIHSCDVFYYKLSDKLGIERLAKYARMLGVGRKSGIDIPGEQEGLMPEPEWKTRVYQKAWLPGETLITSIGQGSVVMTPLQLASLYAAIANKGTLYQPQIVGKITAPNGAVIREIAPVVAGRVDVKPEHFALVRQGLLGVFNEPGGTAYSVRLKSLLVAGKTGTAQVRRMGKTSTHGGGPYEFRDHAWIACYAPADDPEIVVVALVEHGGFGGHTAGPVAMQVVAKYAQKRLKLDQAPTEAEALKGTAEHADAE
jgi:penicillin-binding protein 2